MLLVVVVAVQASAAVELKWDNPPAAISTSVAAPSWPMDAIPIVTIAMALAERALVAEVQFMNIMEFMDNPPAAISISAVVK